jgi:hypothetical protein
MLSVTGSNRTDISQSLKRKYRQFSLELGRTGAGLTVEEIRKDDSLGNLLGALHICSHHTPSHQLNDRQINFYLISPFGNACMVFGAHSLASILMRYHLSLARISKARLLGSCLETKTKNQKVASVTVLMTMSTMACGKGMLFCGLMTRMSVRALKSTTQRCATASCFVDLL